MKWVAYGLRKGALVRGRVVRRRAWLFCALLSIGIAATPQQAASQAQVNQIFNSQGPGPRVGPSYAVQSADAAPNGSESGAVQTILPDFSLGANTYFAGTPNGGIWVTSNGGASWKPLTDNQASLSIGSLSLDPTDASGKTIIAGIGVTDNREYSQFNFNRGRGGPAARLLFTPHGRARLRAPR